MKFFNYISNPKRMVLAMMSKGFFNWLNDKTYLELKTKLLFGKKMDLDNPKTFNEKLQWLKVYDQNPIYTSMVDKYEAKKYVADRIGEEYIIPTIGRWDKFEDIDFEKLPNQFVLKCTHDSGGLVICKSKDRFDRNASENKINRSLKRNYYYDSREWPYKNVKPAIIAENYMQDARTNGKGLRDYKFYCFEGKPKYLYVSEGLENHSTAKISFLTLDWQFAPFARSDYAQFDVLPEKPDKFDEMLIIAERLAKGHHFIRVDLYEINAKVFFSELTFFPCSGMMPLDKPEWGYKLGDLIELPCDKRSKLDWRKQQNEINI